MYETSEAIVAGIGQGDLKAEKAMIEKFGRALIYVLEKRTGDSEKASDLCQETFLVVLQKLRKEPIAEPAKLSAYLHKTAINLHIGILRKESRRKTMTSSEIIDTFADSRDDQFKQLSKERASKAVRQLINELQNDRDRKILMLYYIQEQDKSDICKELELSDRHFDRVISRARSRFRTAFECSDEFLQLEISAAQ